MIPVILSGGSGSRLWPVSRASFPKQFCDLLDESLFAKTVKRLAPLGSPWVITVREMKTLTERALRDLGISADQALYEPFGKNTAPAVALVCKRFELMGRADEIVGIFPADHLIDDEAAFQAVVREGEKLAASGSVVTLGIQPTYPATGYGYIETSETLASGAKKAVGFREKPNEETAREFLSRGGFFWNAGMFIFRVSDMISLFKKYAPDVWIVIDELDASLLNLDDVYKRVRSISIDYAIMERLPVHLCIPCKFDWSDLGSWDSIADVLGPKASPAIQVESRGNFVFPYGEKTYGFVAVDDLVVVDTADALMIARRGETELVKQLVDKLKVDGNTKVTEHRFEIRTWGRFEILADELSYKAKLIEIDPGAQISYQSHAKRSESWTFIAGDGEVILDNAVSKVKDGDHVHINVGVRHSIRNLGKAPLRFVEVQTGNYLDEDDIIRFDDDYNRSQLIFLADREKS